MARGRRETPDSPPVPRSLVTAVLLPASPFALRDASFGQPGRNETSRMVRTDSPLEHEDRDIGQTR